MLTTRRAVQLHRAPGRRAGRAGRILLVGRYEDRYHREADGWYLADRLFHVDLDGDQSRHFGAAS